MFEKIRKEKELLKQKLQQIEQKEVELKQKAKIVIDEVNRVLVGAGIEIVAHMQNDCVSFQEGGSLVDAITRDDNGVWMPKNVQKAQFKSTISHQNFSTQIPKIYNILKKIPLA